MTLGMFNASDKKSGHSRALIQKAFAAAVEDGAGYTLAYGYFMKNGLLSKKMFSYAVGFQAAGKKLALVPIDSDGNQVGAALRLNADTVTGVKKTMQGGYRISTSLTDKPVELIVPAFVPDAGEDAYQLPINQQDEAAAFLELMKGF